MRGQRCGFGAVVVLLLSILATPAVAQVCLGVPLGEGQTYGALRAQFPDGANRFGIKAANRISGPITVGVQYMLNSFDGDIDSRHTIGGEVSYDLPVAALAEAGFALCPTAGIFYTSTDPGSSVVVPFGVGIGGNLEVGDGLGLAPYIVPGFHWQRFSNGTSSTNTDFGFNGGANLLVNNLFFGAFIEKIGDFDLEFGVQAGIRF
jgi:hypothetical protein